MISVFVFLSVCVSTLLWFATLAHHFSLYFQAARWACILAFCSKTKSWRKDLIWKSECVVCFPTNEMLRLSSHCHFACKYNPASYRLWAFHLYEFSYFLFWTFYSKLSRLVCGTAKSNYHCDLHWNMSSRITVILAFLHHILYHPVLSSQLVDN